MSPPGPGGAWMDANVMEPCASGKNIWWVRVACHRNDVILLINKIKIYIILLFNFIKI